MLWFLLPQEISEVYKSSSGMEMLMPRTNPIIRHYIRLLLTVKSNIVHGLSANNIIIIKGKHEIAFQKVNMKSPICS